MPGSRSGDESGSSRSVGEELVAAAHQTAREVGRLADEQRLTNEGLSRLAEQFARGRRANLGEHVDIVDHVDDLPGRILRVARSGSLDPPPPPPKPKAEGEGTGEPEGATDSGNLDVKVGGKRVIFISATVRAAALWVVARLLPWAIALGGGGYVVHDQVTRGDRQAQQRRLDARDRALELPPERQLLEPRLELPARPEPRPGPHAPP